MGARRAQYVDVITRSRSTIKKKHPGHRQSQVKYDSTRGNSKPLTHLNQTSVKLVSTSSAEVGYWVHMRVAGYREGVGGNKERRDGERVRGDKTFKPPRRRE